jgi:hypothetical protein
LCGGVLVLFGGITDRLIPLYAVGAFLAFTLSQAGMVMHWWKNRGPNWLKSAFVDGPGALVTVVTTASCWLRNSVQGAWITLLFIPLTIVFFAIVRRHYHSVKVLTTCKVPVDAAGLSQHPIALIAIDCWSNITRQGIEFAARLSPEVIALHVEPTEHSELIQDHWEQYVEQNPSARKARCHPSSTSCLHPTALSSFPLFTSSSTFRRNIPLAALLWSYRSLWRTDGTNTSSTINVAGFWNGCFSPAAMNASSR